MVKNLIGGSSNGASDGAAGASAEALAPSAGTVVVLVERRTLFRECLERNLTEHGGYRVVGVPSIRAWLERTPRPDAALIILSAHADAEDQGLLRETIALAQSGNTVPVVIMSDTQGLHRVLSALKTGVRGYIPTSMPLSLALEAMRLVCAGGTYIPAESVLAARSESDWQGGTRPACTSPFTARQLQVVEALRRGKANKAIAFELNMCESTVKVHVRHIMKKLQARNRTEVAFKTNELLGYREHR